MSTETGDSPALGIDHSAVVRWLANPTSYAERPSQVEVVETHISHVFLTDRFVYKLKKPVRFDFLDFSTLKKRENACRDEVRLNRRMAPEVYLDVVPITHEAAGRLQFGGAGETVDWVVRMRRLPAERMFDALLRAHRQTDVDISRLAEYFSGYYASATPLVIRPRDYHQRLIDNVDDNFSALLAADGVCTDRNRRIHAFQLRLLKCRSELFQARVLDGRIIDGHGDLRPEHVCLVDPPAAFDCIEFNEALRHIDVLDELCFFAMECDALEAESIGERILETCLERSHDRPPPELTAFYKSYRACVRAKVAMLRSTQLAGDDRDSQRRIGDRYLKLADRYLGESGIRPSLIIVSGLMGTGKSTLARALSAELGAEIIRTDEVRNELFPAQGEPEPFGQGKYSAEGRRRVYEEASRRAAERLSRGVPIILDGTFASIADRDLAMRAGRDVNADVLTVRCVCPREIALERIGARLRQTVPDASEARPEFYDRQAALWETGVDEESTCVVETTASISEQLGMVFEASA